MSRLWVFAGVLSACGNGFFQGDDDPPDASADADTDVDSDSDSESESDTGSDVPDCIDDRFEDNNHVLEASEIELGTIVEDLVVCDGDDDWFAVPMTIGQSLVAVIDHTWAADSNLVAQVIGPDGDLVLYSIDSEDDDEIVRWWPWAELGDGTYYLRVSGRRPFGGELARTEYTLEVEVQDGIECVPDDHEEDDAFDAAGPVPPEDTGGAYTICPADADWFTVDVEADDSVVAFAKYYAPHGHLDLEVLDATGVTVLASAFDYDPIDPTSFFGREHVVYTPAESGTFLLRIAGAADVANEYALVVYARERPCVDDAFEENDFVPWATPIEPGERLAQICVYDTDWWSFDLTKGQTVHVGVLFPQSGDLEDLDAYLFEPDTRSELDASSSSDADEELTGVARETGTHYVAVQGFEEAENAYTLRVEIE